MQKLKRSLTVPEFPNVSSVLPYISTKPAPPEETFMMESDLFLLHKTNIIFAAWFKTGSWENQVLLNIGEKLKK